MEKSFNPFFSITKRKLDILNEKIHEYPTLYQNDRLYHGDYSTYLAIFEASECTKLKGKLSFKLTNLQSSEFSTIVINLARKCEYIVGDPIFKLAAKVAIDDEIRNNKSDEAIALSVKYQVPCKLTSFFVAERLMDLSKSS